MTENIENIQIDELLGELQALKEENEFLKEEIVHYKGRNLSLVQRCRTLAKENQEMSCEIADMKFTRKYLTAEDAGKRFAQELLRGA